MKKIKYEKGDLTVWVCLSLHPKDHVHCDLPWGHTGEHSRLNDKGVTIRWRRENT